MKISLLSILHMLQLYTTYITVLRRSLDAACYRPSSSVVC